MSIMFYQMILIILEDGALLCLKIGKTFSCGLNAIIDSKPPLHPNNYHVKCSHAPCLSVQSLRFTEYHVAQRTKLYLCFAADCFDPLFSSWNDHSFMVTLIYSQKGDVE